MKRLLHTFHSVALLVCLHHLLATAQPTRLSSVRNLRVASSNAKLSDTSEPHVKVITSARGLTLMPHRIALTDGRAFNLRLPEGFAISVAAQGLKRVRFMARSPDGRIFVTDMYDLSDNKRGVVYILDGFDPARKSPLTPDPTPQYLVHPLPHDFQTRTRRASKTSLTKR